MKMITLFKKSNFCPKIQFWQNPNILTSFSPNFFFWQFFWWNQSCQQLKSPKSQHFHEFFTQKNRQFSPEIKVEFLDKKWRFRTVWTSTICNFRATLWPITIQRSKIRTKNNALSMVPSPNWTYWIRRAKRPFRPCENNTCDLVKASYWSFLSATDGLLSKQWYFIAKFYESRIGMNFQSCWWGTRLTLIRNEP